MVINDVQMRCRIEYKMKRGFSGYGAYMYGVFFFFSFFWQLL